MKAFILLWCCLIAGSTFANNLFKNGNLMDPTALNRAHVPGQEFIDGWFASHEPNPTYFYKYDDNHASPRLRDGIIGLQVYKSKSVATRDFHEREFIQGVFEKPLEAGKTYYLSFDLALHETSKWAVSSLGLAFFDSDKSVVHDHNLSLMRPDIRLSNAESIEHSNWMRYHVKYRAKGGEQSIVFGAFGPVHAKEKPSLSVIKDGMHHSAFYYVDDFYLSSVMPEGGCFYQNQSEMALPSRTTLLLDFSSSMRKGNLMDEIQESISKSMAAVNRFDHVTIVGFASTAKVLYDGRAGGITDEVLEGIIDRCKLSGGTNVYSGLKEAFDQLGSENSWREDRFLLISDGEFSVTQRMKQLVDANREVELQFLHLGAAGRSAEYEALGMGYVSYEKSQVKSALHDAFVEPLNANACTDYTIEKNTQYTIIVDNSGSMAGEQNHISQMIERYISGWDTKGPIQLVYTGAEGNGIVYNSTVGELGAFGVTSVINEVDFEGGDDWGGGFDLLIHLRKQNYAKHKIVMISDLNPNVVLDDKYPGWLNARLYRNSSEFIAMRLMDAEEQWETYFYNWNDQNFDLSEKVIPFNELAQSSLISANNGYSRYLSEMEMKGTKKRRISDHREEHPLFAD